MGRGGQVKPLCGFGLCMLYYHKAEYRHYTYAMDKYPKMTETITESNYKKCVKDMKKHLNHP